MNIFVAILSVLILGFILWDAFEAVVLPRRVTRQFRFTRLFYRGTWIIWSGIGRKIPTGRSWRDVYLGIYGPLSLILLLVVWAASLIFGFALLQWSIGSQIKAPEIPTFTSDLYMSASTFFTLGLGDITPTSHVARAITVVESGMGFGFLALIISYLPVLYQAFSRRETDISLLDARAGSPPTAVELLRRYIAADNVNELNEFLKNWELWSAEVLESHLSYPVLAYYRSQHSNESWLGALTMVLDVGALVMVGIEGVTPHQAQLTFAMARHAVVDLCQVFDRAPDPAERYRLNDEQLENMREILATIGVRLVPGMEAQQELARLRLMYEPFVIALAKHLLIQLPPWYAIQKRSDNWQTSAWDRVSMSLGSEKTDTEEHF